MEDLLEKYPQFIGLCLREFVDFVDDRSEYAQVRKMNFGLLVALETKDIKLIDYILNDHFYLWDK